MEMKEGYETHPWQYYFIRIQIVTVVGTMVHNTRLHGFKSCLFLVMCELEGVVVFCICLLRVIIMLTPIALGIK